MTHPEKRLATHSCLRRASAAVLLAAYFVWFNWSALKVHFAPDEMMNLAYYWRTPPWQLVLAQFTPWSNFYRPMGGIFAVPLLALFGLDPLPFHAVLLLVLAGAAFLVYRFGRRLGCGELCAALVAMIVCYHAGLAMLYNNSSLIYDALCGLFHFAAFDYYAGIRSTGRILRAYQILLLLGLYLCALNSKEMAVTLPAVLLLYEWFYHPRPRWRELPAWVRAPGVPIALAALLTGIYLVGPLYGPGALGNVSGYRMEFSWARVADFQLRSFGDFFLTWFTLTWVHVLIGWVLLTALAFRTKRPVLRFCWFFFLVSPLPIEFLEGRSGACLYIPLAGLAVFAAVVCLDAAQSAAALLARLPVVRLLGQRGWYAALVVAGMLGWIQLNHHIKTAYLDAPMAELGGPTWDALQQLRALHPVLRPHTTAVFLDDPFDGYDMKFIAELWARDRTVNFVLQRITPLSGADLARADYLFRFVDGKLIQVK